MVNLTLPESTYYGTDDSNKKQFVKLYKKLKLKWDEHAIIDGKEVSGWFNIDKTEYVIKLQEINKFKRLSILGCQSIVDFFKGLGAVEFEPNESVKKPPVREPLKTEIQFIGSDLRHHYRIEEMLKSMPDNWDVRWK